MSAPRLDNRAERGNQRRGWTIALYAAAVQMAERQEQERDEFAYLMAQTPEAKR